MLWKTAVLHWRMASCMDALSTFQYIQRECYMNSSSYIHRECYENSSSLMMQNRFREEYILQLKRNKQRFLYLWCYASNTSEDFPSPRVCRRSETKRHGFCFWSQYVMPMKRCNDSESQLVHRGNAIGTFFMLCSGQCRDTYQKGVNNRPTCVTMGMTAQFQPWVSYPGPLQTSDLGPWILWSRVAVKRFNNWPCASLERQLHNSHSSQTCMAFLQT